MEARQLEGPRDQIAPLVTRKQPPYTKRLKNKSIRFRLLYPNCRSCRVRAITFLNKGGGSVRTLRESIYNRINGEISLNAKLNPLKTSTNTYLKTLFLIFYLKENLLVL